MFFFIIFILFCSFFYFYFFFFFFFFFNDTATTEIYTLSLHDALPIDQQRSLEADLVLVLGDQVHEPPQLIDRKSTRLNSSHVRISYAVFCLKKKKKTKTPCCKKKKKKKKNTTK